MGYFFKVDYLISIIEKKKKPPKARFRKNNFFMQLKLFRKKVLKIHSMFSNLLYLFSK